MKQLVRMQHLTVRNSLLKEEIEEKSKKIANSFLKMKQMQSAKTILIYIGVKSEVQTLELIKKLLLDGKKVIVPITLFNERELILSEIKGVKNLIEKKNGLIEPKEIPENPIKAEELDLIVIPGVAFDKEGYRIGTGFGFYDKLLRKVSSKMPLIGFCFEENLVERLPAESHDIKMNIVITDKQVVKIG